MFRNITTLNPTYFKIMEHLQHFDGDEIQQYFQSFTNPSLDFSIAAEIAEQKKISIYAVDNDGNTIINYILSLPKEQYNEDLLITFLNHIKDNDIQKIINTPNNNGLTPLHYISINQYEKIYKYFIYKNIKFNYNSQDNKKRSPLHYLSLGIKQDLKLKYEKERIIDFINKLQNNQITLEKEDLIIDIDYDKVDYNVIYNDNDKIIQIDFFIKDDKNNYFIIKVYNDESKKNNEDIKDDKDKNIYNIKNNTLYEYLLYIYNKRQNKKEDKKEEHIGGNIDKTSELYKNVKYKLFYIFKDYIFNFNFKTDKKEININNIYSILNYKYDKNKDFDEFIKEYYEYMINYNYVKQIKKYREMYSYYYDNFKNINYVYINYELLNEIYNKTSLKINDIFNYTALFYLSRLINNPIKYEKNEKILEQLKEYYDYDKIKEIDIQKFIDNPNPIINLLIFNILKQIDTKDEEEIKMISYILKNVFTQNIDIIIKILNDYQETDIININKNEYYKEILLKLITNPEQELKEYEDFVVLKNNIEYTVNSKEIIKKITEYYNENLFNIIEYMVNNPKLYDFNEYKIFSLNEKKNDTLINEEIQKEIKEYIEEFKEEDGIIRKKINEEKEIIIIKDINNNLEVCNNILYISNINNEEIDITKINNIIIYINRDIIEYVIIDFKREEKEIIKGGNDNKNILKKQNVNNLFKANNLCIKNKFDLNLFDINFILNNQYNKFIEKINKYISEYKISYNGKNFKLLDTSDKFKNELEILQYSISNFINNNLLNIHNIDNSLKLIQQLLIIRQTYDELYTNKYNEYGFINELTDDKTDDRYFPEIRNIITDIKIEYNRQENNYTFNYNYNFINYENKVNGTILLNSDNNIDYINATKEMKKNDISYIINMSFICKKTIKINNINDFDDNIKEELVNFISTEFINGSNNYQIMNITPLIKNKDEIKTDIYDNCNEYLFYNFSDPNNEKNIKEFICNKSINCISLDCLEKTKNLNELFDNIINNKYEDKYENEDKYKYKRIFNVDEINKYNIFINISFIDNNKYIICFLQYNNSAGITDEEEEKNFSPFYLCIINFNDDNKNLVYDNEKYYNISSTIKCALLYNKLNIYPIIKDNDNNPFIYLQYNERYIINKDNKEMVKENFDNIIKKEFKLSDEEFNKNINHYYYYYSDFNNNLLNIKQYLEDLNNVNILKKQLEDFNNFLNNITKKKENIFNKEILDYIEKYYSKEDINNINEDNKDIILNNIFSKIINIIKNNCKKYISLNKFLDKIKINDEKNKTKYSKLQQLKREINDLDLSLNNIDFDLIFNEELISIIFNKIDLLTYFNNNDDKKNYHISIDQLSENFIINKLKENIFEIDIFKKLNEFFKFIRKYNNIFCQDFINNKKFNLLKFYIYFYTKFLHKNISLKKFIDNDINYNNLLFKFITDFKNCFNKLYYIEDITKYYKDIFDLFENIYQYNTIDDDFIINTSKSYFITDLNIQINYLIPSNSNINLDINLNSLKYFISKIINISLNQIKLFNINISHFSLSRFILLFIIEHINLFNNYDDIINYINTNINKLCINYLSSYTSFILNNNSLQNCKDYIKTYFNFKDEFINNLLPKISNLFVINSYDKNINEFKNDEYIFNYLFDNLYWKDILHEKNNNYININNINEFIKQHPNDDFKLIIDYNNNFISQIKNNFKLFIFDYIKYDLKKAIYNNEDIKINDILQKNNKDILNKYKENIQKLYDEYVNYYNNPNPNFDKFGVDFKEIIKIKENKIDIFIDFFNSIVKKEILADIKKEEKDILFESLFNKYWNKITQDNNLNLKIIKNFTLNKDYNDNDKYKFIVDRLNQFLNDIKEAFNILIYNKIKNKLLNNSIDIENFLLYLKTNNINIEDYKKKLEQLKTDLNQFYVSNDDMTKFLEENEDNDTLINMFDQLFTINDNFSILLSNDLLNFSFKFNIKENKYIIKTLLEEILNIVFKNIIDNINNKSKDIFEDKILNNTNINKQYLYIKFNKSNKIKFNDLINSKNLIDKNIIDNKILFNSNKNILSINNSSFNIHNVDYNLNIINDDLFDNLYNTFNINNISSYIIHNLNLSNNIFKSIDIVKEDLIKNNIFEEQNYNELKEYLDKF